MTAVSASDVTRFVDHLAGRDRAAAIAQAMELLDAGIGAGDLVTGLLGPAQREVGRLWEVGQWSVAQEHVATGITDDVLQAVGLRQGELGGGPPVVVACTEGEYHAMPARMLTEVLRAQGLIVTFLGASLPTDSLATILVDSGAVALALSCSLSPNLVRASLAIDVAHAQGVPVIVGGAAFGATDRRARALGADAWSSDAAGATSVIRAWAGERPAALNVGSRVLGDDLDIAVERRELIDACVALATREHPALAADGGHVAHVRRGAADIVDHLAAAVRTADPSVLADYLAWRAAAIPSRQPDVVDLVRRILPARLQSALRVLDDARGELRPMVSAA